MDNNNKLAMLSVVLYVGPLFVINLSMYDEANRYLHQTQMCCGSNDLTDYTQSERYS